MLEKLRDVMIIFFHWAFTYSCEIPSDNIRICIIFALIDKEKTILLPNYASRTILTIKNNVAVVSWFSKVVAWRNLIMQNVK